MSSPNWTILKLLKWTEERFKKEGISSPRLEAEVLLAETLGLDRVGLYVNFDRPLEPAELSRYKEIVKRRLQREPLAYITGKKEFWSLTFKVTPDVLIPRPETETLIEEALKIASTLEKDRDPLKILEIGTGSGAIIIVLARELPSAHLVATDISEKALAIARENAFHHGVAERIQFIKGDLFPANGQTYDLILTNPPYIPRRHVATLPPEVRIFEPPLAWDGGEDGLDFYRRILSQVDGYLKAQGWFLAEIGAGQEEEIKKIVKEIPSLDSPLFVPDLSGIKRVIKMRKK